MAFETDVPKFEAPEHLDTFVRAIDPWGWILWAVIVFFIIGGILWGVLGTATSYVSAVGVFQASNRMTDEVIVPYSGRIAKVFVSVNDMVVEGDLIARLEPPASDDALTAARDVLRTRQEQIQAAESRRYAQVVSTAEGQISPQEEATELQNMYAPVTGLVGDVLGLQGDMVSQGEHLTTITSVGGQLRLVLYVANEYGDMIEPGMEVRAFMASSAHGRGELVKGCVSSVSSAPVARETIGTALINRSAPVNLDAPYKVFVNLVDGSTFDQYQRWRIGDKQSAVTIASGQLARAQIVLGRKPPLEVFFPFLYGNTTPTPSDSSSPKLGRLRCSESK